MAPTWKDEVLNELRKVIDPDLHRDIVSLGFIKELDISETGDVSFQVELTTPACPVKDMFKEQCQKLVADLSWSKKVSVTMTARKGTGRPLTATGPGLAQVDRILAISSCKGGVGKSTVALNTAYALAKLGGRVGLLDADIYGPSLPALTNLHKVELESRNGLMEPIMLDGVKLFSYGFVKSHNNDSSANIMRGPMVSNVLKQMLCDTNWGTLDYLVIDMPPGTGDIQLTLSQLVSLTAAIIVTTPQELSFVDVVKGIKMFDKLNVPTISVVENMSYFMCDGCTKKHYPFGKGAKDKLVQQFGITNSFELPIDKAFSTIPSQRKASVIGNHKEYEDAFMDIASAAVKTMSTMVFGDKKETEVTQGDSQNIVVTTTLGSTKTRVSIPCRDVRAACRCALCVDEMTGEQILKDSDVSDNVETTEIHRMGNYAVAILWSDGHTSSIYPYELLRRLGETRGTVMSSEEERSAPPPEKTSPAEPHVHGPNCNHSHGTQSDREQESKPAHPVRPAQPTTAPTMTPAERAAAYLASLEKSQAGVSNVRVSEVDSFGGLNQKFLSSSFDALLGGLRGAN